MIFLLSLKGVKGKELTFPIKLDKIIEGRAFVEKEFNNKDELIDFVYARSKEDETEKEKKLDQICLEIGLHDTVNLIDQRSISLVKIYKYYNSNTTPSATYNYKIWFDTVLICEQFFNKKISLF